MPFDQVQILLFFNKPAHIAIILDYSFLVSRYVINVSVFKSVLNGVSAGVLCVNFF